MLLSLSNEQELIASSAVAFLSREYCFRPRRTADDAVWHQFAEMGWLGLSIDERFGGLGADALTAGLLLEAMGRHLVVEPYASCAIVAARALARLGSHLQQSQWLPAIAEGRTRAALAHDEASMLLPWDASNALRTTAVRTADGWTLRGAKNLTVDALGAGALLVTACTGHCADDGLRMFLIDVRKGLSPPSGLSIAPCLTVDGLPAGDLVLDDVHLGVDALLGEDVDVQRPLAAVCAHGLIAACWEACGAMTAAYEQTAAYVQQRHQFGQPLAAFQVVAHRLAEMAVRCTEARAACEIASLRVGPTGGANGRHDGDDDAMSAASCARIKVAQCADFVAKEAVQLHGAIGVTDELPIASYFRKLMAFQARGGSAESHAADLGLRTLASGAWRSSATLQTWGDARA